MSSEKSTLWVIVRVGDGMLQSAYKTLFAKHLANQSTGLLLSALREKVRSYSLFALLAFFNSSVRFKEFPI